MTSPRILVSMPTTRVARPRTRLSPEARRKSILEAARSVAVDQGLVSLTLKSVGTEAGVASSLVAHYFPVMDDLVIEVFLGLAGDELETLVRLQGEQRTATNRMRILVDWLLRDERLVVTAVWLDATLLGRRNDALAAEMRVLLDRWQETVAGSIQRGVDSGEFACPRPAIVAAHVLSLIDGLNTNALVGYRDSSGLETYLRELIENELAVKSGTFARQ